MSAPPVHPSENYRNLEETSPVSNDERAQGINIHLSMPTEPITSTRDSTGDFAADMSLQAMDSSDLGHRDPRYQSLRGNTAYVTVNRPNNQTSAHTTDSLNHSLIDNNNNNNVGSGSTSSIKLKQDNVKSRQSPFFGARTGTASPISSILSSGSKLLQQSMRVINLEPGSLRASTFTVITAMVGGGTLTIPYGIKMAGTLTGLIYLILACLCGAYSTWALIFVAEKNNCRSYRKLAKKLFGQNMAYFIQIILCSLLWCVCVSYMTLTKELLYLAIKIMLNGKDNWEDNQFILLTSAVIIIVLPLALMRKVSALRYASMIGLCVVTFTCGLVTVLYFHWCSSISNGDIDGEKKEWETEPHRKCLWGSLSQMDVFNGPLPLFNTDLLNHTYTIAICIGGFADHPTVLPIYFEMQRRSPSRMKKCLIYGFLIVLLLYIDIGYFGYFTFPTYVQPNLLSSDYRHNPVMLVTAACLCLYVVSVVPLFAHAFRKSIAELMIELKEKQSKKLLLNDNGERIKKQEIAPEALDVFEYPEDHIAFVPNLSPRTQETFNLGKPKMFNININNNNNNQKEYEKNGNKIKNESDDDSDTFESAESFDMDNIDNSDERNNGNARGKNKVNNKNYSNNNNNGNNNNNNNPIMNDPYQLPLTTHVTVTILFIASALVVALFADNIGTVNSLIGSTTMPICCFVFPAMCAWKTEKAPAVMKYGTITLSVVVMISSGFQLARQFMEWF